MQLCDFGLAASQSGGAGTASYMAPELLDNAAYTYKVDVYAFGVLLNEMLARKAPFCGADPARISERVVAGQRPELAGRAPTALLDMIKSCWQADPVRRPDFASIQGMLVALNV